MMRCSEFGVRGSEFDTRTKSSAFSVRRSAFETGNSPEFGVHPPRTPNPEPRTSNYIHPEPRTPNPELFPPLMRAQVADQCPYLVLHGCCLFGQSLELGFRQIPQIQSDVEVTAQFERRGGGDIQEADEFAVRKPPKALRNVRGNRHRCPAHLASKLEISREALTVGASINGGNQSPGHLPDLQVFELSNSLAHDSIHFENNSEFGVRGSGFETRTRNCSRLRTPDAERRTIFTPNYRVGWRAAYSHPSPLRGRSLASEPRTPNAEQSSPRTPNPERRTVFSPNSELRTPNPEPRTIWNL